MMGQQISVEDAFPTFQRRLRELFEENLLLRAQVDVLERQLAEAQGAAPTGGPDLAAPPSFAEEQQG